VELNVEPRVGRVDTVPRVVVGGASGPVSVEVVTTDAAGHRWQSSTTCPVGADGTLVLDDPERPWWDMAFTDVGAVPVAFTAPDSELRYEVTASAGDAVARADVVRFWRQGPPAEEVRGEGFALRIYRPAEARTDAPGVVVVPGSTGTSKAAPTAALLAAHGYVAAVLGYMQEPGLPSSFCRIPVEAFVAGLRAFAALPAVDSARVGVLAVSVGVVGPLVALGEDDAPPVRAVVVVSPTHVVWQGLSTGGPPPKAPMLTRDGRDLPYVPIRGDKVLGQLIRTRLARLITRRPRSAALGLLAAYRGGLADRDAVGAAAIAMERVAAPVLAAAGTADAMWPSGEMAQELLDRRRRAGAAQAAGDRLVLLPGAGHFLRPPVTPTTVDRNESLISGGHPEATARGQRLMWDEVLRFLADTVE
jgi:dienelactone hydrolase